MSADYELDDFPPGEDGYYRVYYGGADSAWGPDGPYPEADRCLYDENGDYPRDGYIVYFDGVDGVSSVPSLPGLDD